MSGSVEEHIRIFQGLAMSPGGREFIELLKKDYLGRDNFHATDRDTAYALGQHNLCKLIVESAERANV